jgi:peptidyl-prolyl cis-trans isomerase A (cyclophilin A)
MSKKGFLFIVVMIISVLTTPTFANTKVLMETSLGNILLELDNEKAPISSENFLHYVNEGFYNGLIFHRVIPNFMIQAGGFNDKMEQKPANPPIKNEADNGLKNNRGTIAMARTNKINSATSQFFINLIDNNHLNYISPNNYGYAVFGHVIEGMDVVDKIAEVKTGRFNKIHQNVPLEPVYIIKAHVVE